MMKAISALVVATLLAVPGARSAPPDFLPLWMDTPREMAQCVPTHIEWYEGIPRFNLTILFDYEVGNTFDLLTDHTLDWATDVKRGTVVQFVVTDGAGEMTTSAPVNVGYGKDTCSTSN